MVNRFEFDQDTLLGDVSHGEKYLFYRIHVLFTLLLLVLFCFYLSGLMTEKADLSRQEELLNVKIDLYDFALALDKYKIRTGNYPDNVEGLAALFQFEAINFPKDGYFRKLKEEPLDPWGENFFYRRSTKIPYLVKSLGPDNVDSWDDLTYVPSRSKLKELIRIKKDIIARNKDVNIPILFSILLTGLLMIKLIWNLLRGRKSDKMREDRNYYALKIFDIIADKMDKEDKLYEITLCVDNIFDTIRCSFVYFRGAKDAVVVAAQDNPKKETFKLQLKNYPELREVQATHKILIIDEIGRDPLLTDVQDKIRHKKFQAIMVVPIFYPDEDRVMGAFFLRTGRTKKKFTAEDVYLCNLIAQNSAGLMLGSRHVASEAG